MRYRFTYKVVNATSVSLPVYWRIQICGIRDFVSKKCLIAPSRGIAQKSLCICRIGGPPSPLNASLLMNVQITKSLTEHMHIVVVIMVINN